MVTPYLLYPPLSGGQTRSFNLVKHLARKCEITLFSYLLPDQEREKIKYLKRYCRRVVTIERGKTWTLRKILFTGVSPYSFLMANYFSPRLKKMILGELEREKYDLIHVECFYLMPNIPRGKVPILLVDQTIEFAVYQHFVESLSPFLFPLKFFLSLDVAKIKFWETFFWKKADILVAVSHDDRRLMERYSKRKVAVVPNGVDNSFLRPLKVKKYRRPTILFGVANFKWIQNKEGTVNLLKYVWPKVKKAVPQAQLIIAGRHSVDFINRNKKLLTYPESVRYGEVKEAKKVYHRSWVMVAPMGSGGGSRTKFFEAMACGLPVITTPSGIEGIEAQEGEQVVVEKSFDRLAQATVRLLNDRRLRERIGRKGRLLVKEKYSWEVSAQKLLSLYQRVANDG